jgi:4-carboxymuconolactone decarboxylase
MNSRNIIRSMLIMVIALITNTMNAQNSADINKPLDAKQQSIVKIAALTAAGDLEQLKTQLSTGLDSGLTVNEIKEVLVQLYAYCGFPRSLNGISTFMSVMDDRKAKGINDPAGKEAKPETVETGKYERGRKTLEALTKTQQVKPAPVLENLRHESMHFLKNTYLLIFLTVMS